MTLSRSFARWLSSPRRRRPARPLVAVSQVVEPLEQRVLLTQTTGLFLHDPGTSDGLTLFSPNTTTTTYLIDKDANIVNQWDTTDTPGLLGYLLPDGSLMRMAAPHGQGGNGSIVANGSGGLLEQYDWDGNKI